MSQTVMYPIKMLKQTMESMWARKMIDLSCVNLALAGKPLKGKRKKATF